MKWCLILYNCFLCGFWYISATKEPLEAGALQFSIWTPHAILKCNHLPISCPRHPLFCEHLWYYSFTCATDQIFYLIWGETLKAATSTRRGLKGNKMMHLLCKLHTCVCQAIYNGFKCLKPFILQLLMCTLDWFSKIQSRMVLKHLLLSIICIPINFIILPWRCLQAYIKFINCQELIRSRNALQKVVHLRF